MPPVTEKKTKQTASRSGSIMMRPQRVRAQPIGTNDSISRVTYASKTGATRTIKNTPDIRKIESRGGSGSRGINRVDNVGFNRQTRRAVLEPKKIKPQSKKNQTKNNVWIAMGLFFTSIFIIISSISYIENWQKDQSVAVWDGLFSNGDDYAYNWGGKLGAIVSENIIGKGFGIFGVLIAFILMIISVKCLSIKELRLVKFIRSTTLLMLIGSIVLGHFAGINTDAFSSGWGGALGIVTAKWMQGVFGYEGTTIILVFAIMGLLYYVNATWFTKASNMIRKYVSYINQKERLNKEIEVLRNREIETENGIDMSVNSVMGYETEQSGVEPNKEEQREDGYREKKTGNQEQHQGSHVKPENKKKPYAKEELEQQLEHKQDGAEHHSVKQNDIVTTEDNELNSVLLHNIKVLSHNVINRAQPIEETSAQLSEELQLPVQSSAQYTEEPIEQYELLSLDNGQMAIVIEPHSNVATLNYLYVDLDNLTNQAYINTSTNHGSYINNDDTPAIELVKRIVSNREGAVSTHKTDNNVERHITSTFPAIKNSNDNTPEEPILIVGQPKAESSLDDRAINNMELYDPTLELRNYKKPPVELLKEYVKKVIVSDEELLENKKKILYTLGTFGIKIDKIEATVGPTVTLYEIIPAPGVRISKIKNLEDDIALSLAALGIRIIAPIPGKGTIGIEVPNRDKEIVSMYSVIKSTKFHDYKGELPIAIGKTIQNETFVFDLAKMPHLLVAGATGQGKSVGLNAIITSLLYKKHPAELKFILVDPKKVELSVYALLEKHFLAKIPDAKEAIITENDKVIHTLNSLCMEMDDRYDLLKNAGVRGIKEYNDKFIHRRLNPEKGHRFLPYFVVIIDEFADLIMTAGREVETPIARIAQLARAVGIHLIIATQRPTTNIITGVIKANFPARVAFRVTSQIDSRTILDSTGANQLIGRGDMLISTGNEITRVQCAFVDTPEVERITAHISSQKGYVEPYELPDYQPETDTKASERREDNSKRDPLFEEVARYVVANQSGSASTIQRKFSIGFNRAGRLIDQLETVGIVGAQRGSKPREVLISDPMSLESILIVS